MSRGSTPVVVEAKKALDTLKLEIAGELGGPVGNALYEFGGELGQLPSGQQTFVDAAKTGYYGNVSSRDCGVVGGGMTRRLVQNSETRL